MTALITLAARAHELLLLLPPLAADPVPEPEDMRPGWVTLVVVLLLVAASTFLWFSMRKQLGRIRVPKEGDGDSDGTGPDNDRPSGPPVS